MLNACRKYNPIQYSTGHLCMFLVETANIKQYLSLRSVFHRAVESKCFTLYAGLFIFMINESQTCSCLQPQFFSLVQFHTHTHTLLSHFFLLVALWQCCTRERIVICSSKEFCAEQWFCSSRTHLMPHWNPIITTMERNELLLTWSAVSWFREVEEHSYSPSLRHACTFLFFILFSFSSLHSILPQLLPPAPTHIHTLWFQKYQSQPFRPIRIWKPHLTRQAGPRLLQSNKHTRALTADGLYRHEAGDRAGKALRTNERGDTMTKQDGKKNKKE